MNELHFRATEVPMPVGAPSKPRFSKLIIRPSTAQPLELTCLRHIGKPQTRLIVVFGKCSASVAVDVLLGRFNCHRSRQFIRSQHNRLFITMTYVMPGPRPTYDQP